MITISRVAAWAVWRDMGGASQGTSAHPLQAQAPGLKCYFIKYPNQYDDKSQEFFLQPTKPVNSFPPAFSKLGCHQIFLTIESEPWLVQIFYHHHNK